MESRRETCCSNLDEVTHASKIHISRVNLCPRCCYWAHRGRQPLLVGAAGEGSCCPSLQAAPAHHLPAALALQGGSQQEGNAEARGYPRGGGAVAGVTGQPRAALPPAQRDLKASRLVSPQEPSEECARKSTTSPRTRITSRTRPSISSVSPLLRAAPEPRPQQPPSSPQLAGG